MSHDFRMVGLDDVDGDLVVSGESENLDRRANEGKSQLDERTSEMKRGEEEREAQLTSGSPPHSPDSLTRLQYRWNPFIVIMPVATTKRRKEKQGQSGNWSTCILTPPNSIRARSSDASKSSRDSSLSPYQPSRLSQPSPPPPHFAQIRSTQEREI